MANKKTNVLTITGAMLALGVILSFIKIFEWPFGGSITLASMVPIVIIGFKYGPRWGVFSAFMYSILQAVLGATTTQAFAGMYDPDNVNASMMKIALMAFLDYITAFTVLGLSGVFRDRIKSNTIAFTVGTGFAVLLRFAAHFVSGFVLWGDYAESFFDTLKDTFTEGGRFDAAMTALSDSIITHHSGQYLAEIYSFIYNGFYMIPEFFMTVIIVFVIMEIRPINKLITDNGAL
ncbi:MAG: energy-coupled thiamine transporter ThiT [Eubacterium sp.]|nr:energy-coupled thiamine transporter ThiT [Eubacterium sp.]